MLVTAAFSDYVLAIHILGAIAGLGVVFAYPVLVLVGRRLDPTAMPWLHQMQREIGRRVITPGLVVILVAGIVLASEEHQWKAFYVQWGLAAVVVIGGIEGAVMAPGLRRLAEAAERDVLAARGGEVTWSEEYERRLARTGRVGALLVLIVVVTVFLMATHAGAS